MFLKGEGEKAGDNLTLGCFVLESIQPKAKGEAQIEVTLDINANGDLRVSAKDITSGNEGSISITAAAAAL